jgi:hypothetical protein
VIVSPQGVVFEVEVGTFEYTIDLSGKILKTERDDDKDDDEDEDDDKKGHKDSVDREDDDDDKHEKKGHEDDD